MLNPFGVLENQEPTYRDIASGVSDVEPLQGSGEITNQLTIHTMGALNDPLGGYSERSPTSID